MNGRPSTYVLHVKKFLSKYKTCVKRELEEYFMFIQDISIFYIIFYYDLMTWLVAYETFLKNLLMMSLANAMYTPVVLFNIILPET